jgi:hypothetical protein
MSPLSTCGSHHRSPGLASLRPSEWLLLWVVPLQMLVLLAWFSEFWSWGLWGFTYDGRALLWMSFWGGTFLTVSALTPVAVWLARMRAGSIWPWLFVAAEWFAPVGWAMYWSIHWQAAPPDDRGARGCLWVAGFGCLMAHIHIVKAALLTSLILVRNGCRDRK